jgi:lipoprotein-anchoring transpeptidase ErfK/SrfK
MLLMRKPAALLLAVSLLLGLAACGNAAPAARWGAPSQGAGAEPSTTPGPPLSLDITPAVNAKNVPISMEIGTKVTGGTVTEVSLTEGTTKIAGRLREDGSAWVPDKPLRYRRTYTATVTARAQDAITTQTRTTTFTTMGSPGRRVGTGLYLFEGVDYGVGMPVVVEFDTEVPASARAGVERRMFVTTSPDQPGGWAWFGGRQVMYRAKDYWQPGTKLTVRIALDGHPMGNGRYGDMDRRATGTIGNTKTVIEVDNATKKMTVYRDDWPFRTLPVSLGKPATPSSSGIMVIMDKQRNMIFDTMSDPNPENRYRIPIEYAQRLTWGGEFIHAAPWSVQHQGVRNVSHGCVNINMANAQWLFSLTRIGDPVTVRGTERRLDPGNGWTAWDLTWEEFRKQSAMQ